MAKNQITLQKPWGKGKKKKKRKDTLQEVGEWNIFAKNKDEIWDTKYILIK